MESILDIERKNIRWSTALHSGLSAVWPVCFGYIPLGLAMGVLGDKAGLSPVQVLVMSLCVFAGSGQFIAVSMIAAGASVSAIVMTTFMINLRHLLMSFSLAVHLKGVCRKKLTLFCHGIVDETFAVNLNRFKQGNWDSTRAIVVNYAAFLTWVISCTAGCLSGQFVPEGAYGLDYALTAMFISLLVFQLRGSLYFLTAAITGGIAVLLSILIPGNTYIVLASVMGATLGLLIKKSRGSLAG